MSSKSSGEFVVSSVLGVVAGCHHPTAQREKMMVFKMIETAGTSFEPSPGMFSFFSAFGAVAVQPISHQRTTPRAHPLDYSPTTALYYSSYRQSYMAPEQVTGEEEVEFSLKVDTWGLGVVAYELMHRRTPFR